VTQCTSTFHAAPNTPDHDETLDGWLALQPDHVLTTVDALVAAQQLDSFSRVARKDPEAAAGVPPLKEKGVSLLRTRFAEALLSRFERRPELEDRIQVALSGGAPARLFAEDLMVGHRIDVHADSDAPTKFRSLFQRRTTGRYSFPRNAALAITPPA